MRQKKGEVFQLTPRQKLVEQWITHYVRKSVTDQVKLIIKDEHKTPVIHCHYLRSTTPNLQQIEVDHVFECQLISHCMMQTKELRSVLGQVDVNFPRGGQDGVVQNLIDPIYNVHNWSDQGKDDVFNLRFMEKNLNILKGSAFTDFLRRQKSTLPGEKGGPIDFESAFANASVVRERGIITAEAIASKVETAVKDIECPYIWHLKQRLNSNVSVRDHEVRMEALGETINQVFDRMFEGDRSR